MQLTYVVGTNAPSNLWQVIQDFTSNAEPIFITEIPNFVQITEEKIYNSVQLPALRKNVLGGLTVNNQYLTLPPDYLAPFSLAIFDPVTQAQSFLIDKDVNFIREAYPIIGNTGTPQYYASYDYQTYIVGPTPDSSYNCELHYFFYPESIVTATHTWLGDNFADVLLYGALREAYIFMKGEADVVAMYEGKYAEGLALLKKLGDGRLRRDMYRSTQVRLPVT